MPITCKGFLPAIRQDDEYEFTGQWVKDPKWGMQFQFTKAEVILPDSSEGAIRFLASLAKGVGPATAAKIVEACGGDKALENILENPQRILELPFLKHEQAEEIMTGLLQNTVLAELSGLICGEGVGPTTAARIYAQYGKDAVKIVRENPYVLADEVYGLGFKKADIIAKRLGVAENSPYRVQAAYEYMLQEAKNEGHVYLRPQDTMKALSDLLGSGVIGIQDVVDACKALQDKGKVVREGDKGSPIYHAELYEAEVGLAQSIRRLVSEKAQEWPGIEELIKAQETDLGIEYAAQQKQAIATALANPLSVMTGGPGTGKSTTIKGICNIYAWKYPNRPVYLAAPTGKAAKRMEESTGRKAKTIHRLLRFHPVEGFQHNENEPLPGPGLIIIDEVSMMDVELANSLFQAIDTGMTVVLVGDIDQLPSVGPGCVLRDIIDSGVVPTVRLQFNYRQAGGSRIAEYAHWIVGGRVPPLVQKDGDYECRVCDEAEDVLRWVKATVEEALEQGMGAMDFQVLAPQHKGTVGVGALNELVRELVNPASENKDELKYGRDTVYRLGDKVLVTKNNYTLGVFNGDMGIVKGVAHNGLNIDIDGWEIFFPMDALNILTHAYAMTIHKSQGSEFKWAIVVCHTQQYYMLQRNLLYTGITRAKNRLVLLTNERAMKRAVGNDKQAERLSLLKERLRGE
jgi:exodeoxyribonuclease V alpha subunit